MEHRIDSFKQLQPFGAELPAQILRDHTVSDDALRQLLKEHDLLVIRGLTLELEAQVELLSRFGAVLRASDGIGIISTDPETGNLGRVELHFHSDMFYGRVPYTLLSLYAADVVAGESSTLFANAARAAASLPAEQCQVASEVYVRNSFRGPRASDCEALSDPGNPNIARPLMERDSYANKVFISANASHSCWIEGPQKGSALLDSILCALYVPENIYEHIWTPGDLVIWNNATVQHARKNIEHVSKRTLHRVVVAPFSNYDLHPALNPAMFREGHKGAIAG